MKNNTILEYNLSILGHDFVAKILKKDMDDLLKYKHETMAFGNINRDIISILPKNENELISFSLSVTGDVDIEHLTDDSVCLGNKDQDKIRELLDRGINFYEYDSENYDASYIVHSNNWFEAHISELDKEDGNYYDIDYKECIGDILGDMDSIEGILKNLTSICEDLFVSVSVDDKFTQH